MSLQSYQFQRMVVLNPSDPVLEAARAIENNSIGAIVVYDGRSVVGLLTDRDLAVRVVGRGLDPKLTMIGDVMTTPVTTLSPADSHDDAIRLMQQKRIRRIPLVDEGRVVGIVTLDDLLLDEAASLEQLAMVIEAQIGAGGPLATLRWPPSQRSAARAEGTYGRMRNQLRETTDLETAELAETALEVVIGSIVQRLTPNGANNFIAQLPSLLQQTLRELPPGPDKTITDQAIKSALMDRLDVNESHAWRIIDEVIAIIENTVSPGQLQDLEAQLPKRLRELFVGQ